jgi:hypothetical protein
MVLTRVSSMGHLPRGQAKQVLDNAAPPTYDMARCDYLANQCDLL